MESLFPFEGGKFEITNENLWDIRNNVSVRVMYISKETEKLMVQHAIYFPMKNGQLHFRGIKDITKLIVYLPSDDTFARPITFLD